MEMEVVLPVPPVDFNFDSACSSPYMTAPSSPQRFGSFFLSAPTSPSRASAFYRELNDLSLHDMLPRKSASSVPFNWEEKPGIPKSRATDNDENDDGDADADGEGEGEDFEFNFSGQLERTSLSADELFDGGKIRPLKPPPRLQVGDGRGGGGNRGGSYGKEEGGYGQAPPAAPQPYYGGASGNQPPPHNSYGENTNYGLDAVPPPTNFAGGPASYPPSYGAPPPGSYGGDGFGDGRGRGGPPSGYDGGRGAGGRGGYGGAPAEDPAKVRQCDENCDDSCDNSRIYISNLPPDVTTEELRELFGGIGQVGRIKQKRGYKDQWPWNIKLYTDEMGNNKGDGVLSFEDPSAAHSAGGFFNNYDMRGYKINVAMAAMSAPKAQPDHRGGGRGGYGGGDRRRDNYRDGSGPDRHQHGGNRSRPY